MRTCKVEDCDQPTKSPKSVRCQPHSDEWVNVHRAVRDDDLPVAPLLDYIDSIGGKTDLILRWDCNDNERERIEKALHRAKMAGRLKPDQADLICCKLLRLHPSAIFGDDWWLDVDEIPEDEEVAA